MSIAVGHAGIGIEETREVSTTHSALPEFVMAKGFPSSKPQTINCRDDAKVQSKLTSFASIALLSSRRYFIKSTVELFKMENE